MNATARDGKEAEDEFFCDRSDPPDPPGHCPQWRDARLCGGNPVPFQTCAPSAADESRAPAREQEASDAQKLGDELSLKTSASLRDLSALSEVRSSNWRHGFGYQPSAPESFHRLVGALPIAYEDYVFVDFGSGKGRSLLLAASYPFKRIIGVEYSPPLHAAAEENIAAYDAPGKKCRDITSVCADATLFPIPREPAVLYFYNPFDAVVLEPVVENICRSLTEFPRKVFVVYYNALYADVFREHGFREVLRQTDAAGPHVVFESA